MSQPIVFADVLDAAEQLDTEAQVELVAILSRRLADRGRKRVGETVAQARREFAAGQCQAMTAAESCREAFARSHGYDVPAMVADLRERDDRGDWPVVRLAPRRPAVASVARSRPAMHPLTSSPVTESF